MTTENNYKKFVRFIGGMAALLLGVTLILMFWQDVVSLFRGFAGLALALGGLLALYSVRD
ncbi:MAG: hypothetical protein HQL23_06965 [Candidatus Omnitrophica bacterium]|nr:hypothetical protein [Candidatus Omnitrophota bacterium]